MSEFPQLADERAQAYDRRIRAAIPGYDALHVLACDAVAEATNGQGRVLVVGAGTGAECVALGQSCPGLRVTGIDPAPEMLAVARAKVAAQDLGGRVRLIDGFVGQLPVAAAPYDAATLLLVLHFLPDDGAKTALLRAIAQRLRPGAALVLADVFGPHWDDPGQQRLRNLWRHLQQSAGLADEAIQRGFAHVDRDIHPVTETRLGQVLAEAGFAPPQPFFRALCFGGWLSLRRADR